MCVFWLIVSIRKGVYIAGGMVHTLFGLHVEAEAGYCACNIHWLQGGVDWEPPQPCSFVLASGEYQFIVAI